MRWFRALIEICVLGAAIGFALGLLQRFHPAFDSFSHFRLHFLFAAAFGVILLVLFGRFRRVALLAVAAMLVLAASMLASSLPQASEEAELRIAQFNLQVVNTEYDVVLDGLRSMDVDIVLLQEMTFKNREALAALKDIYPHQEFCQRRAYGGVGILSKAPLGEGGCLYNFMWRQAAVGGRQINVGSVHLYWPWPHKQHDQIDRLLSVIETLKGRLVIGGDFNAAPWSNSVARMQDAGGLERLDGAPVTILVKGVVPVPIDHQLHSADLCPVARKVGPSSLGSDHFPVVVGYRFGVCS